MCGVVAVENANAARYQRGKAALDWLEDRLMQQMLQVADAPCCTVPGPWSRTCIGLLQMQY